MDIDFGFPTRSALGAPDVEGFARGLNWDALKTLVPPLDEEELRCFVTLLYVESRDRDCPLRTNAGQIWNLPLRRCYEIEEKLEQAGLISPYGYRLESIDAERFLTK